MDKITTTPDQKMSVSGGTIIIADVTARTGLIVTSIQATADSTLTVCSGSDENGNAVNFLLTPYFYGTLKAGDPAIILKDNCYISSITLSSGRIFANQF